MVPSSFGFKFTVLSGPTGFGGYITYSCQLGERFFNSKKNTTSRLDDRELRDDGFSESATLMLHAATAKGISELQKLGKELLGEKLYDGVFVTVPRPQDVGQLWYVHVYIYIFFFCTHV